MNVFSVWFVKADLHRRNIVDNTCCQQKREKAFLRVNADNIHIGNMLTTKISFPSVSGKHQRNAGNMLATLLSVYLSAFSCA
jgi:hypothetical protein